MSRPEGVVYSIVAVCITAVVVLIVWAIIWNTSSDREVKQELRLKRIDACRTVEEPTARAACVTFAGER